MSRVLSPAQEPFLRHRPSNALILHLMSAFPPLIESFILREVRQLHDDGWNVAVAGLRPVDNELRVKGFEDLDKYVSPVTWVSADLFIGTTFFVFHRPRQVWECLKLVFKAANQPVWFVKMLYTLLSSLRFAYRFRNSSVGMVRAHFLHTEALGARFINKVLDIPYSVTVYTVFVHYPRSVIQDIVHHADVLVADTSQTRQFLESLGAEPKRICVVHNSVRIEDYPLRIVGSEDQVPLLLAVARLCPKKGFDVLLHACSILRGRGVAFRCAIVGDGGEMDRLLEIRRCLGLETQVEMVGKLAFPEIKHWYYKADVFAMPSIVTPDGDSDGLPTVVVEAMASGLPVVGTTTGGIPDAVSDGLNGFLVPPSDPNSLADRIQLLIENRELRHRFGREGRHLAESAFNLKLKGEALSRVILEHLDSRIWPPSNPAEFKELNQNAYQ